VTDKGFFVLGEKEDGTVGLDMISTAKDTIVLKNRSVPKTIPLSRSSVNLLATTFHSYS